MADERSLKSRDATPRQTLLALAPSMWSEERLLGWMDRFLEAIRMPADAASAAKGVDVSLIDELEADVAAMLDPAASASPASSLRDVDGSFGPEPCPDLESVRCLQPEAVDPAVVRLDVRQRLAILARTALSSWASRPAAQDSSEISLNAQRVVRMLLDVYVHLAVTPLLDGAIAGEAPEALRVQRFPPTVLTTAQLLEAVTLLTQFVYAKAGDLRQGVAGTYACEYVGAMMQLAFRPPAPNALCRRAVTDLLGKVLAPRDVVEVLTALMNRAQASGQAAAWLLPRCGQGLAGALMRPTGLAAVIDMMLGNLQNEPEDDAYNHVVRLVTSVPRHVQPDAYMEAVGPQLVELLLVNSDTVGRHTLRVARVCIMQCLASKPLEKLTGEHVLAKLWQPMVRDDGGELSSAEVERVVEGTFKLVTTPNPPAAFFSAMVPIVPVLFRLFVHIRTSATFLRSRTATILARYLQSSRHALSHLVIILSNTTAVRARMANAGDGGVAMTILPRDDDDAEALATEEGEGVDGVTYDVDATARAVAESTVELLEKHVEKRAGETLSTRLFLELLEEFCRIKRIGRATGAEVGKHATMASTLAILYLLEQMSERVGPSLLRDVPNVVRFLDVMLQDEEDEETVALALAVLSSMVTSDEIDLSAEDAAELCSLEPRLAAISEAVGASEDTLNLCSVLRAALTSLDASAFGEEPVTGKRAVPEQPSSTASLKEIMHMLRDPLLPVRGHGLICLRRFILDGKRCSDRQIEQIFGIFAASLQDTETYIYLTAIQGLAAVANVFPEQGMTRVAELYTRGSLVEPVRLKLGEVMLDIAERSGEMLPHYAPRIVPACLANCRADAPGSTADIRASALSVLATICAMMHWSIDRWADSIVDAVQFILTAEPDAQVRRAALYLITILLNGMGPTVWQVMPRHVMTMRSMLKAAVSLDKDDACRQHAANGLEVLDRLLKHMLNAQ